MWEDLFSKPLVVRHKYSGGVGWPEASGMRAGSSDLVAEARRKKRLGLELSSEELSALRDYHNRRNRLSAGVYFTSAEQKAEFEAMAKAANSKLSKWILEKASLGAKGEYMPAGTRRVLDDRIAHLESALREEVGLRRRESTRADLEAERANRYETQFLQMAEEVFAAIEASKTEVAAARKRRGAAIMEAVGEEE
jgi:hypothetical protein